MPESGGFVAVHAHPDDETLSTGALLASAALAGRPVVVVTCTRGERGEVLALPGTPSEGLGHLAGSPDLAAHREVELARAASELGVEQVFLDALPPAGQGDGDAGAGPRYVDSGMAWVAPGVAGPAGDAPPSAFSLAPVDEAAGRLAVFLRERRPDVVATYEPGGGYGHPDHVMAHRVTVRAMELAAEPAAGIPGEPWAGAVLWQAVAPADDVRAARRALAEDPVARALADRYGLTFADPDEALPPFARDLRGGTVTTVAVGPVLDRVVAALRAHATQVQHAEQAPVADGVAGWYALSGGILTPILAEETYLVG